MHHRICNIVKRSAQANGWEFRGTLEGWEKENFVAYGIQESQPPSACTFWFHLKDNPNVIIGFDWRRKNPSEIKCFNGRKFLVINLSYVSSHKKLNDFLKESAQIPATKEKKTLLNKLGKLFQ